jgi:hypothetical protein
LSHTTLFVFQGRRYHILRSKVSEELHRSGPNILVAIIGNEGGYGEDSVVTTNLSDVCNGTRTNR